MQLQLFQVGEFPKSALDAINHASRKQSFHLTHSRKSVGLFFNQLAETKGWGGVSVLSTFSKRAQMVLVMLLLLLWLFCYRAKSLLTQEEGMATSPNW